MPATSLSSLHLSVPPSDTFALDLLCGDGGRVVGTLVRTARDYMLGAAAYSNNVAGATTTYTYDAYNRVRTVTDADNYTVTYDYGAADRLTKTTYPDGTYEEIVYDKLDPARRRDRLGRWSETHHDANRRVDGLFDVRPKSAVRVERHDSSQRRSDGGRR